MKNCSQLLVKILAKRQLRLRERARALARARARAASEGCERRLASFGAGPTLFSPGGDASPRRNGLAVLATERHLQLALRSGSFFFIPLLSWHALPQREQPSLVDRKTYIREKFSQKKIPKKRQKRTPRRGTCACGAGAGPASCEGARGADGARSGSAPLRPTLALASRGCAPFHKAIKC